MSSASEDKKRVLVRHEVIKSLSPIEGSDFLEVCGLEGSLWSTVVPKGKHKVTVPR